MPLRSACAMPKLGCARNELTAFRYDVVVRADAPAFPGDVERIMWSPDQDTHALCERLRSERPRSLLLANVQDRRSEAPVRLCSVLANANGAVKTVREVVEVIAATAEEGLTPDDVHRLVNGLPYGVQLRCATSGGPGRFDVLLWRMQPGDAPMPRFSSEPGRPRLWRQYSNNPLRGVVAQGLIPEVRAHLKSRLPEHMVPAVLMLLDELPLNPSGKVDRQALPAPDGVRPELAAAYVAPRTPTEVALAQIWAEVLGVDQVGIDDNFFELGGDSILSIQIIARANRSGLRLTPPQLFQHQTVAELAAVAGQAAAVVAEQEQLHGEVPLTPIQRWFFEWPRAHMEHFNQAMLLVSHHDALRLRFAAGRQFYAAVVEATRCERCDVSGLMGSAQSHALAALATQWQGSLDLSAGPLLRAVLFELGGGRAQLLLVIHHLAVDGVSWRILLEDLASAYAQRCRGEIVQLPAKTTSFRHWGQRLVEYAAGAQVGEELAFWRGQAEGLVGQLPVDHAAAPASNTEATRREVVQVLDEASTQALLQQVPAVYGTQINDALLNALLRAWWHWSGQTQLWLDVEGHGREDLFEGVDLTRTVGWFTSLYPVRLELRVPGDCGQTLQSVKEQLRRVPRRGIGYGVLRYLSAEAAVRELLAGQVAPAISFNYLGQLGGPGTQGFSVGAAHAPGDLRRHLLELNGSVEGGRLRMAWGYSERFHDAASIEALARSFDAELRALVEHCRTPHDHTYTPADFPEAGLSREDLNRVLAELGSTPLQEHRA
jgi:non-ribosomal peptide synthase protein (TIGR01720 family)